jgi:hypothetical protein
MKNTYNTTNENKMLSAISIFSNNATKNEIILQKCPEAICAIYLIDQADFIKCSLSFKTHIFF